MFDIFFFFFQAEDGIRDGRVTGVQTCALPICLSPSVPLVVGLWSLGSGGPGAVTPPAPGSHRSAALLGDRKSTRLNSSHPSISYAVFCLKKKKKKEKEPECQVTCVTHTASEQC